MVTSRPDVPADARFNAKQACEVLGISRNTLKKYVRQSGTRPLMQGKRAVYTGLTLLRFWEGK